MSIVATKLSQKQVMDAMKYAYWEVHGSLEQGVEPAPGSGGISTHFIDKLGQVAAEEEFASRGIGTVSTPLPAYYGDPDKSDNFMLRVDDRHINVAIMTTDVFGPLDGLPTGDRFYLSTDPAPFGWDWIICLFVNTQNLTYLPMGCVEREHVDVYAISGSKHGRQYEIPLEFLLPIECIWEDCSWKDR